MNGKTIDQTVDAITGCHDARALKKAQKWQEMAKAELKDRTGFGLRWGRCARTVTGWLAEGLPHIKLGHRSVVINVAEGDKWVMNRFRVRRIPKKVAA